MTQISCLYNYRQHLTWFHRRERIAQLQHILQEGTETFGISAQVMKREISLINGIITMTNIKIGVVL
jgi:hypothetical protein